MRRFVIWMLNARQDKGIIVFPRRLKQCLFRKWATGSPREHYRSQELSSAGSCVQMRRLITGSFLLGLLSPWCWMHRDRESVKSPAFSIQHQQRLPERAGSEEMSWNGIGLFQKHFYGTEIEFALPKSSWDIRCRQSSAEYYYAFRTETANGKLVAAKGRAQNCA